MSRSGSPVPMTHEGIGEHPKGRAAVVPTPKANGLTVSGRRVVASLPLSGARLMVVDARGRCVRLLAALPAGVHSVSLEGLGAGMYTARLVTKEEALERQMLLLCE